MPPKKKQRTETLDDDPVDCTNASLHKKIRLTDEQTRADHKDIVEAEPLDMDGDGGRLPAFDKDVCARRLAAGHHYVCTGNFWWMNVLSSATPNTPIPDVSVNQLKNFLFGDRFPAVLPTMVIRVPHAKANAMKRHGLL